MQVLIVLVMLIAGWIMAVLAGAEMTEADARTLVVVGLSLGSLILIFGSHAAWLL